MNTRNPRARAVIVEAVRTPIGRGRRDTGYYRDVHPAQLLGLCFSEVLSRAGVNSREVDNVVSGCVYQIAEQSAGIARTAWLHQGLSEFTGATTIDVRCGSGQQAVNLAALRIEGGVDDVVVAGGIEHMGRVGFPVHEGAQERWGRALTSQILERYALVPQGIAADLIANQWRISREAMDDFALRSHRRAYRAAANGHFAREITPVPVASELCTTDQGVRPDTSVEALRRLEPAFQPGGRITAGNASQVSDGASALLLMSRAKAESLGVRPRADVVDQVVLGVDPVTMLTGPIPATHRILARNRMSINDIDAIEVNEAFASVVLAWERELKPEMDRVNRRGGAIALGHPVGASGARLITTLLHILEDEDLETGLVTMCCGGGVGTATLIQRV